MRAIHPSNEPKLHPAKQEFSGTIRAARNVGLKAVLATALLAISAGASAGVCERVNQAKGAILSASAAAIGTEAVVAAVPVTAVTHSSGALILTGAGGYIANTMGFVAGTWAAAAAPVTITLAGVAAVAGGSVVAYCHYVGNDAASEIELPAK